jgi:hypothetical protein
MSSNIPSATIWAQVQSAIDAGAPELSPDDASALKRAVHTSPKDTDSWVPSPPNTNGVAQTAFTYGGELYLEQVAQSPYPATDNIFDCGPLAPPAGSTDSADDMMPAGSGQEGAASPPAEVPPQTLQVQSPGGTDLVQFT